MQKIKAHKQAFRRALRILYWVGLMILYLCAASRPGVWLCGMRFCTGRRMEALQAGMNTEFMR